jgi:MFS family permease
MGVLSAIMDVGQSAGPIVAGTLIAAYRYNWTFGLIGIAMIVISLVYGLAMRRYQPKQIRRSA